MTEQDGKIIDSPTDGNSVKFFIQVYDDEDDIAFPQQAESASLHKGTDDSKAENGYLRPVGQPSPRAKLNEILDSLFVILSGLYGIFIVVLGSVIPLTESFVHGASYPFEVFYMYLYGGSVLFLIYVYAYLLRRNRIKSEFISRTLSRSMSWTRSWAKTWATSKDDKGGKRRRRISMDESNHHTGTFYLRLGAVGFGIGSMILSGLHFGQFFQIPCTDTRQAIKPLLHLLFTFIQLYFIFMNSKMCIHRMKKLARFGLMHMCATNICVWFRCIVVETLHAIHSHHSDHKDVHHAPAHLADSHTSAHAPSSHVIINGTDALHGNATYYTGRHLHAAAAAVVAASPTPAGNVSTADLCYWRDMMGKAVDAAAPYLYPCTIEYSLMSAGILYVMWHNVGKKPRRLHSTGPGEDDDGGSLRNQRMSVDCTGSSRGLFLGIFLMVGAIITVVAFYVLVSQEEMNMSAIALTHMSETIIYLVTVLTVILAANRMKHLRFHSDHKGDLEDTLILISYTGLICFAVFSLIAAVLHPLDVRSALTIVTNLTMIIQATIQTLFMLAGDRVSASNRTQERRKPGREFVTFLLLCNFAMWIINTFETQKPEHNPIQVEFYGNDAWAIFTHISVPLGIYYRFHSTVCLSNIWKNAWKMRKHSH